MFSSAFKRIIVNHQQRPRRLHLVGDARNDGKARARRESLGHEIMGIMGLALDRHENVAGRNRARVDGNAVERLADRANQFSAASRQPVHPLSRARAQP